MTTIENQSKSVDQVQKKSTEAAYSVRALRPEEWPAWDAFAKTSPQGTVFHATDWLKASGTPFQVFGCFKKDALIGGIVLQETGLKTAGHSYHTPYLGVVLPPPVGKYLTTLALHKNISLALASHVKTEYRSVRCRMSPEMLDLQPFAWTGYSIFVDYTYRASLADLEETWMGMEDKKRNDIRKAEREGIVVDQTATLTDILALEEMTLQRKGKIIDFGEAELRREAALRASHQCRSFVAKSKEGAALAGVYLVWDEKCAYYLIGGHSSSSAHRGAASLAIWEAMRYAGTTLALKKFDFAGGNMRMLERFFRDFGGSLTPRYEIVFEQPSLRRDLKRIGDRVKRVLKLG